jgi:TetR/AcrR family transcriptional regulator, transcriptional repressor for nem operon
MTKSDTRQRILDRAAEIIHRKGFNNTGIQEILDSAEVPKGSFYFYFKSKEALGLALIDYHAQRFAALSEAVLKDSDGSPLERLKRFFDAVKERYEQEAWKSGCPIGNLTQEMASLNPAFQTKLKEVFARMATAMRDCLHEACAYGEINPSLDVESTADFIVNSWEGALLRMKAEGSIEPLKVFQEILFNRILKA